MSAPLVTRPPATVEEEAAKTGGFAAEDAAQWVKWVIIGCMVLGAIGLVVAAVVSVSDRKQTEQARAQWDEVYSSLKDKTRPEDKIAALEEVAAKVKGTPSHAYVLMQLGDLYFDQAVNATKSPEEQAGALKKATDLYKMVATSEPYSSNPAFGPIAIDNAALALEQAKDYNGAISLLEENLKKWESHFLYNKMAAQLGRLYWLRSLSREKPEEKEKDRELAREKLSDVLRQGAAAEDYGKWREQAKYIKSLVDKRGKLLPEGAAVPAAKPVAAPAPKAPPAIIQPPGKADPPKTENKSDQKKPDEKKTDDKKKDETKKEEKKTDNSNPKTEQPQEAALSTSGASGHLSFSQIQQMLKEGKTSFCQCPRCDDTEKEARARLIE